MDDEENQFISLSLTIFILFRVHIIRFSSKVLTALCEQIEGIPISGVIVVGDGQAARSIALSGNAMKVPVLWAKGGTAQLHTGGNEVRDKMNLCKNCEMFSFIRFTICHSISFCELNFAT